MTARSYLWVGFFLFITGLLCAGCGSSSVQPSGQEADTLGGTPEHTVRYVAAYSTPATAPDGSMYVLHGTMLQHYSAGYALLDEGPDLADIGTENILMSQPDLYIDQAGRFYIGSEGALYILDTDKSVLWQQSVAYYISGSLAVFDDGALFAYKLSDGNWYAGFVDDSYSLQWNEQLDYTGSGPFVSAASSDRFILQYGRTLKAVDAAGAEIYNVTMLDTGNGISAFEDYVAVATSKGVYLYRDGELQWTKPSPDYTSAYNHVLMPSADKVIVNEHVLKPIYDRNYILDASTGEELFVTNTANVKGFKCLNSSDYLVCSYYDSRYTILSRSLTDGSVNWSRQLQERIVEELVSKGQLIESYTTYGMPVVTSDGGFCVVENSALQFFNANGELTWEQPSTIYTDVFIPWYPDPEVE